MRIEIKQNRIAIILSKAESDFITHKAEAAGQKNLVAYIKAKLVKALELKGFEDSTIVNLANNFNLAKIKDVSTELSRRQTAPDKFRPDERESLSGDDEVLISDEELLAEILEAAADIETIEREPIKEKTELKPTRINKEVVDDLLTSLLDKDLVEGRLPEKNRRHGSGPKAPKTRKHGIKTEKDED